MHIGIDQLYISPLKPIGALLPVPDMRLLDRARLYGLETLPAIKVRQTRAGHYEILSGLATWRVAQILRIDNVDVERLNIEDAAAQEMVRGDLQEGRAIDPITRAEMLREHIEVEGLSRNTLCEHFGLSRSQLSHALRLLQLDPKVLEWARAGRLSAGKAKVLVGLRPEDQQRIAQMAIDKPLSTRQVEGAVRNTKAGQPTESGKDSNIQQLETDLSNRLGNPVSISWDGEQKTGELSIRYFGLEELESIIGHLQNEEKL